MAWERPSMNRDRADLMGVEGDLLFADPLGLRPGSQKSQTGARGGPQPGGYAPSAQRYQEEDDRLWGGAAHRRGNDGAWGAQRDGSFGGQQPEAYRNDGRYSGIRAPDDDEEDQWSCSIDRLRMDERKEDDWFGIGSFLWRVMEGGRQCCSLRSRPEDIEAAQRAAELGRPGASRFPEPTSPMAEPAAVSEAPGRRPLEHSQGLQNNRRTEPPRVGFGAQRAAAAAPPVQEYRPPVQAQEDSDSDWEGSNDYRGRRTSFGGNSQQPPMLSSETPKKPAAGLFGQPPSSFTESPSRPLHGRADSDSEEEDARRGGQAPVPSFSGPPINRQKSRGSDASSSSGELLSTAGARPGGALGSRLPPSTTTAAASPAKQAQAASRPSLGSTGDRPSLNSALGGGPPKSSGSGTAPSASGSEPKRWEWPSWCLNFKSPSIEVYVVDDETGVGRWVQAEPQSRVVDKAGRDAYLCAEYEWDGEDYVQDFGPQHVRRRGETRTVFQLFERAAADTGGGLSAFLSD